MMINKINITGVYIMNAGDKILVEAEYLGEHPLYGNQGMHVVNVRMTEHMCTPGMELYVHGSILREKSIKHNPEFKEGERVRNWFTGELGTVVSCGINHAMVVLDNRNSPNFPLEFSLNRLHKLSDENTHGG
jgi:hypothetical protein